MNYNRGKNHAQSFKDMFDIARHRFWREQPRALCMTLNPRQALTVRPSGPSASATIRHRLNFSGPRASLRHQLKPDAPSADGKIQRVVSQIGFAG